MLGVSTSWLSEQVNSPKELVEKLLELSVSLVELEYRLSASWVEELLPLFKKEAFEVKSVHNFLPTPSSVSNVSGNAFSFSSEDKEERDLAVKYTILTMEHALDFGANIVILHLGKAPLKVDLKRLEKLFEEGKIESEEAREIIEEVREERLKKSSKFLDYTLLTLDKILKVAEKYQIFLGIENRYFYDEIPSFEEISFILKEFQGSNLRYWHDVGHANSLEKLNLLEPGKLLKNYGDQMIGIHLHDCIGRLDHRVPGQGEIDFQLIKPYLKPETIKIVEVFPEFSVEELRKGLDFLKNLGID